jgi:hypothetical protein
MLSSCLFSKPAINKIAKDLVPETSTGGGVQTATSMELLEPSSSPGNDTTPSIKLHGVTAGSTVKLYTSENCDESSVVASGVVGTDDSTITLTTNTLTASVFNVTYIFRTKSFVGTAESVCSDFSLIYELDTTDPSGSYIISLKSPATSPGNDISPTIEVAGVTSGSTVEVYSNSSCTENSLLGTSSATQGSTVEFDLDLSKEGTYPLYMLEVDAAGNRSDCTPGADATIVNPKKYQLDFTPPSSAISLVYISPNQSTGVTSSPMLALDGTEDGVKYEVFYNDPTCSNLSFKALEINSDSTYEAFNIDFSSALSNGNSYDIYVWATDAATNHSSCIGPIGSYTVAPPEGALPREITLTNPESVYGQIATPTVEVTLDDAYIGYTVKIFGDAGCSNLLATESSGSSATFPVQLSLPSEGTYPIYAQSIAPSGAVSPCSGVTNDEYLTYFYDNTDPNTPTSLALASGSISPSSNLRPKVTVSGGVAQDDIVHLYTDSSCTNEVGNEKSNGTSVDVQLTSDLSPDYNYLYAKSYDLAGNFSSCSTAKLEYIVNFSISGNVTYDFIPTLTQYINQPDYTGYVGMLDYDNPIAKPVREALVYLIDADTGLALASAKTDVHGNYEFTLTSAKNVSVVVNSMAFIYDDPATGSVSADIIVEDNTSSENGIDNIWGVNFGPISVSTDTTQDLHIPSGWNQSAQGFPSDADRLSAPFAILDAAYEAAKKVDGVRPDLTLPQIQLNWSPLNTSSGGSVLEGEIGTSHYDFSELYILGEYGNDTDEFDRHIVVHEWGHYFEDKLSRSDSLGGMHSIGDALDISLAFGEGWGNALASMVLSEDEGQAVYGDTYGKKSRYFFGFDVDDHSGLFDPRPGWGSEASIQKLLYDIYDTDNSESDSSDHLEVGFKTIVDVMTGPQKTTDGKTSIFTFVQGLKQVDPGLNTGGLNMMLDAYNIDPITDVWGSGQTYDYGWSANLPIYRELSVGQNVTDENFTTVTLYGEDSDYSDNPDSPGSYYNHGVNSLLNTRHFYITVNQDTDLTLSFESTDSFTWDLYDDKSGYPLFDNDNGVRLIYVKNSDNAANFDTTTFRRDVFLSAGTHVLQVRVPAQVSDPNTGGSLLYSDDTPVTIKVKVDEYEGPSN